jgi:hypothetical protein
MRKRIEKGEIVELLLSVLRTSLDENDLGVILEEGENIKLFGGDGLFDSIGLVGYVVEVEEKLEDVYGISLVLANEKAMSRRTSPFARISYLAEYILEEINLDSDE